MVKNIVSLLMGGLLLNFPLSALGQNAEAKSDVKVWKVVRENPQKYFPHTVAPGNYSGITHLHDDLYAVVSDKSDSALYFNFQIQLNPVTGDLERVANLGFTEYMDGSEKVSQSSWQGIQTGFDHEAIAKASDSTVVVASEGFYRLKEYPIIELRDEHSVSSARRKINFQLWSQEWSSSDFYPNYVFESLAYDSIRHLLWTIPESTLRRDGEPATPQNGAKNKLRLMCFDGKHQLTSYAYQMDAPTTNREAQTYVMGVSELCALPDGQLLVLERETFIPKVKLGAFCQCKLYVIDPLHGEPWKISEPMSQDTPFLKKRLLTEWKTRLGLLDRSFANYEGMCLGPQLQDGSQVLILISDSQDQYAGVLRDWMKTIVIE